MNFSGAIKSALANNPEKIEKIRAVEKLQRVTHGQQWIVRCTLDIC